MWAQKNCPCIKKYITILKAKFLTNDNSVRASFFHLFLVGFFVFHIILQRIHQNIKGLNIIKIC